MKKLLLMSLCIWTGLIAGHSQSKNNGYRQTKTEIPCEDKMPCEDEMPLPTEVPCEDTMPTGKPEPFGGKGWEEVYITENAEHGHEIYAYYGDVIKKWDFGGYESTEFPVNKENMSVNKSNCKKVYNTRFTDDHCYLHGYKNVLNYSMHDGSEKNIKMKEMIKELAVCKAGCAIYTKNYITAFNPQGNPKGDPIKVDEEKYKGMQMLDSGELVHYDSDSLSVVDIGKGTERKQVTLKEEVYWVHPKKTLKGDLVLACTHKTIANLSMIQVMNTDNGKVEQSIRRKSRHLKQRDLDGNRLATAGRSTVKLFDLERGKQIYSGIAKGIWGTCALRLQDKLIYFVGDEPKPASTIIDTREKSACND